MCGRFALSAKTNQIEKLMPNAVAEQDWKPRYNIAPTQNIAVFLNTESTRLKQVRWGLVPFWAGDLSIGNKMINARAESLSQKPSFKNLIKTKRCLIAAEGYFEWEKIIGEKNKVPNYIKMADDSLFTFGGLWDEWLDKATGEKITTATIITTSPNSLLEKVHNRMPVIIDESQRFNWLNPSAIEITESDSFFSPYPSELMKYYPVSTIVNNPNFDSDECLKNIIDPN